MSNFGPSELSIIFGFLPTLKDVANASLVCRRWCFLLWRTEEQYALWLPWLRRKLLTQQSGKELYSAMLKKVTRDLVVRRQLPYTNSIDICNNFENIKKSVNTELEKLVRVVGLMPQLVRATLNTRSGEEYVVRNIIVNDDSQRDPAWFVPSFSTTSECALYKCMASSKDRDTLNLFCLRGTFNEQQLLDSGDIIIDSNIVYSGDFKLGMPWGYGTMFENGHIQVKGSFARGAPDGQATYYMPSGAIRYDGEWAQGQQHGEGTMYHEDSSQKYFQGRFERGEPFEGTWYNNDGTLVHFGNGKWFPEQLALCHKQHKCSYSFTKRCHTKQPWWHCKTCYPSTNTGCCKACAEHCHRGHELVKKESSSFFCDCGAGDPVIEGFTCKAMQGCEDGNCNCMPPVVELDDQLPPLEDDDDYNDISTDEVSDGDDADEQLAAAQENDANLQQIVMQQIAMRGGHHRVFLEVDPQDLHVIGLQLVPQINNDNNEEDQHDEENH